MAPFQVTNFNVKHLKFTIHAPDRIEKDGEMTSFRKCIHVINLSHV